MVWSRICKTVKSWAKQCNIIHLLSKCFSDSLKPMSSIQIEVRHGEKCVTFNNLKKHTFLKSCKKLSDYINLLLHFQTTLGVQCLYRNNANIHLKTVVSFTNNPWNGKEVQWFDTVKSFLNIYQLFYNYSTLKIHIQNSLTLLIVGISFY